MDNVIYPNAVVVVVHSGKSIYRREDGFIGYCDEQSAPLGFNPMLMEDEMVSIYDLPADTLNEILAKLEVR